MSEPPKTNWIAAKFGSTDLPKVSSVTFGEESPLVLFGEEYGPRAALRGNPTCSITSRDAEAFDDLAPGRVAPISAREEMPGGAVEWTLANAVLQHAEARASMHLSAWATATFAAYSADGHTSPLSFTADPPPDALMIPRSMMAGKALYERINSILAIAEPLLGVDRAAGGRAYIRNQGDGWLFVTDDPSDTILFPTDSPLRGKPRHTWITGPDGIKRGRLVPEAKS